DVDGGGHGLDGGRMGGVEDRDLRVGGGGADDVGEDVGGEAGAAHAADDDVEHTVVDEALGDGGHLRHTRRHGLVELQPTQAVRQLRNGVFRPHGRVTRPQPLGIRL